MRGYGGGATYDEGAIMRGGGGEVGCYEGTAMLERPVTGEVMMKGL